jgi:hypothetical protein
MWAYEKKKKKIKPKRIEKRILEQQGQPTEEVYVPNEKDVKEYEENLQKQKMEYKEVEANYGDINRIKDELKKIKSDISMSSKEFKLGYLKGHEWSEVEHEDKFNELLNDKTILENDIKELRKQITPQNQEQIKKLIDELDGVKQKLNDSINYLSEKQKENTKMKTSLTKTINVS